MTPPSLPPGSRREFLARCGGGAGALALATLLADQARAQTNLPNRTLDPLRPLAPHQPHFRPRAKHVIWLYQSGGPPSMDLFDYKPELAKLHGQPVPDSIRNVKDKVGGVFNSSKNELMAGPWKFARHGRSGQWFSELMPHTARHADEICFLKSLHSDSSNHAPATYQMNTGVILGDRPSLGSWLTYGLGSENQNLPGYVVLFQVGGFGGTANWSNGFLPAAFQGTRFRHEGEPVFNLQPPAPFASSQRATLDLIQRFNQSHRDAHPGLPDLDGRIAAYELAYRMQAAALDVGDLRGESTATLDLYGVHHPDKAKALYGRQCLLARRLVERGVRVVQTYQMIDKLGWDGHSDNQEFAERNARQTDQAVAALLTDLKQRGLLAETLVVWAGEFGRTPMMQGKGGRNHNPYGFTGWLAGGGIQGGQSIGATDEIGLRATLDPHPVKDFHATILHALGLHHEDLFFEHNGRPERLTGVAGSASVISRAFA
ncbi:MAG: DUF1501 domain-containing protein [Verrucomicrobia bacterium]|nr:DUF1501 domain-containing protein [Verrucomicrobiota bacterium]